MVEVRLQLLAFLEQKLRRLRKASLPQAVSAHPLRREVRADGRIRYWGYVEEFGERALRVVTLADGVTVHNAFPDRDVEEERA